VPEGVVIQILGLAEGAPPTGFDGQFLQEYDPDLEGLDDEGRPTLALLRTTHDIDQARVFSSAREAMALWKQPSKRVPLRPDGKPNRPLSAFSVEIRSLHENREEASQ